MPDRSFTSLRRAAGRGVCALLAATLAVDLGPLSSGALAALLAARTSRASQRAGWAQDAQGPAYSETVTWRIRASRPIRTVSGTQPRVRPSVKTKPCTKTVQPCSCPGWQAR